MRTAILLPVLAACANTPPSSSGLATESIAPPPEIASELVATETGARDLGPVGKGELPWWHDLRPAIYRWRDQVVVLAVGDSKEHHHVAEGFLQSRVEARLAVRKAAERIGFTGQMPEPQLFDLFVTRDQRFFALYRLVVPSDAALTGEPNTLEAPRELSVEGMHRRGRHVFEGNRHLFLECDVEGPIANPDWGRSRASARY